MKRFLVIFRSHVSKLADIHFVRVNEDNGLKAIKKALRESPPCHSWVLVRVYPWPRGCKTLDQAVQLMSETG